jgi:hypothetical protein
MISRNFRFRKLGLKQICLYQEHKLFWARATDLKAWLSDKIRMNWKNELSDFTKCYLHLRLAFLEAVFWLVFVLGWRSWRQSSGWLTVDLLGALARSADLAGCLVAGWRVDRQPKYGSAGGGSFNTFHNTRAKFANYLFPNIQCC